MYNLIYVNINMTTKLIIVISIILILTIILQVYNIELIEYSGNNLDDIYTSHEFNMLSISNNLADLRSFVNTDANNILKEYKNLPYNELISRHDEYKDQLFDHYLLKEENSINTMLGDVNTKYVYLTKTLESERHYYNRAGEYMANIGVDVYVWQPLSYGMLSKSEDLLRSKINSNSNSPYIECWIREDMRSGNLNIPINIKRNYRLSRPDGDKILEYENDQYNFKYVSSSEIRTGSKVIRYMGPRRDGIGSYQMIGRIFDKRGPNMSSGNEAYNEVGKTSYNHYWDQKYQTYLKNSVDWLNGNVKCFGLQWEAGELFYSEDEDICNSIENLPEHSYGWPHPWALNFYRIEEANDDINHNTYRDRVNLSHDQAKARRLNIKRRNNTLLILKQDL